MQTRPFIESELLLLEVDPVGAEPHRLLWKPERLELLWQGDAASWARRAPHLFPIVGRLNGDLGKFRGLEMHLSQHGFARDRKFIIEEEARATLRFTLREDAETLAPFPFHFGLEVSYAIEGAALRIGYRVSNPGSSALPFCLGAHPGFRCPLRDGERFEDYELRFDVPETTGRRIVRGGLLARDPEPFLENRAILPLSYGLFERDAIVLKGLRSRWVELRPRRGGPSVRVSLEGWPHLGIWTKPGAPFLCIEPWHGLADSEGFEGEFDRKEGAVVLGSGERFVRSFSIEIRT